MCWAQNVYFSFPLRPLRIEVYFSFRLRPWRIEVYFSFPLRPLRIGVACHLAPFSVQPPRTMRQRKRKLWNYMGCVKDQVWKWLTSLSPTSHGPCSILSHGAGGGGGEGHWEMKFPRGYIQHCLCHTSLPKWHTILSMFLPSEYSSLIEKICIVLPSDRWAVGNIKGRLDYLIFHHVPSPQSIQEHKGDTKLSSK